MIISTREAFLVKKPTKPIHEWVLAADGHRHWTEEFMNLRGITEKNQPITFDYALEEALGKIAFAHGVRYSGTLSYKYWYHEFPDGKNVMIIEARQFVTDNIENIKEWVVKNYDSDSWNKQTFILLPEEVLR